MPRSRAVAAITPSTARGRWRSRDAPPRRSKLQPSTAITLAPCLARTTAAAPASAASTAAAASPSAVPAAPGTLGELSSGVCNLLCNLRSGEGEGSTRVRAAAACVARCREVEAGGWVTGRE